MKTKLYKYEDGIHVEMVDVESIVPYINNAKQHPLDQVELIAASIKEFGFNDPIAIDENKTVIEGHGRLLAARKLGLDKIPVIQLFHLSEAQKKAYILAHNKLCLNTGWDLDVLKLEFERLQELDFTDIHLTGFRPAEIDILFATPNIPDTEPELDENILGEKSQNTKQVTCPACSETFYV